ncbi:MAG: PAS domain-containing protein [Candidatus Sumerlaeota bacterium]|nr:PAS domain-containing protein [Candidatus Sumerlaeota bacterium]
MMIKKNTGHDDFSNLRRQAEAMVRAKAAQTPESLEALSPEAARKALHELHVHQIELEMQNEELRRTQGELEALRERYFDLYDLAPVGYITLSEQGLIQEANLTATGLLGVERGALVKQPLTRFILPEDQDIYYRHHKQLFETGAPQVCEFRMLRANIAPFWACFEAITAQDANGALVCRVLLSDISERKRSEEFLAFLAQCGGTTSRRSFFESLAHYLAESLGMDFVCIDRLEGDGLNARTVAVWSDGRFEDNMVYALKDTPCGEAVGKTVCCFPASVRRYFPRDDVLRELRAESYVGVTLWSHTNQPIGLIAVIGRRPLANRSLAEATLKMVAVRAGGELERLAAEEALRQSEAALNKAQKVANVGSWVWHIQTNRLEWSDQMYRIFGMDKSAFTGDLADVIARRIHPDDRAAVERANRSVIQEGKPMPLEYRVLRPDGTMRIAWAEAGELVLDAAGQPALLTGIVQDITERKRAEAEKAILEAQNWQLQKAESLGRMAGAIAHHFNNQLQSVMGYLELAMGKVPPNEDSLEMLAEAMQAAQRAAEVSGSMLTYLGLTFVKHELLNLSETCRRGLPMLRAFMPKDVDLEADLLSPGPAVSANASQIQQALTNLVTNAWEAIGEERGAIHVTIKTVAPADIPTSHRFPLGWKAQNSAYACLEVVDAGCGIADKDIEKIFDPFFSTKFTGRGMGLPVVLGIAKAHDGAVTVASEPGRGSAFRVFLPVAAVEAP